VRFSPTGTAFAFSSENEKRVLVMDSATGETLLTLQHADGIYDLAWDAAGERLATGCRRNGVYLWDAKTGRQLARFGDSLEILSVAFHPDGNILAGSDYERTRLWNVRTGQELATANGAGLELGFSRDGALLSSLGWAHEVFTVFNVASGDECRAIRVGEEWTRFSSCPRLGVLAAWGKDRVLLFDEEVRDALASLPAAEPNVFFDPFATSLFICDGNGMWRWPAKSPRSGTIEIGPRQALSLPLSKQCQLAGDGRVFITALNDRLDIYDAATLALRTSTAAPIDQAYPITSPNGEWIAIGHWSREGVQVWNARTGKLARELPSATISIVSFSPDGRWLAVRDHQRTRFWNVGTWTSHLQLEHTLGDTSGAPVAFTQNGRIAALRSDRSKVLLIEIATGRELGLLESPDAHDVSAICFVADDTRLVVSMDKYPMRVWDLRRVRQQLAAMNLDWEAPPLPAQPSKPVITSINVLADPPAESRGQAPKP
jgi:WD40 repeat protein